MLLKLLSYLYPFNIVTKKSTISKSLEITWVNGELVLDSKNTNYSYGSLQRILKVGLRSVGFEKIRGMQHILILGVAGGSVIKTLVNDINYNGKISGVEIDPKIIKLANDYFKLNEIPNLEIIIDDAIEFVFKTKEKYDLIIVDIFQDNSMPGFLFEKYFANQVSQILSDSGVIIFNTMIVKASDNERNIEYLKLFDGENFLANKIPRVEQHNELIIIEKKYNLNSVKINCL